MLQTRIDGSTFIIALNGRIDSTNAAETERELFSVLKCQNYALVLDFDGLTYISSVGLRVILRLKKAVSDVSIINVHSEIYGILEMTGFTEMMQVQKAYRTLSIEGCPMIGQGANGRVYRINSDTAVKVYKNENALSEIMRERDLARKAFVAGIPTAIPYDVVRIKNQGYGSVFELLDASSLAKLLADGSKSIEETAVLSCDLMKLIHSKTNEKCELTDMRQTAANWIRFLEDYLPDRTVRQIDALIKAMPEDRHFLHGDFHLNNIVYQNDECLLIDMDTFCCGNPIFELSGMYNNYVGYGSVDEKYQEALTGIPRIISLRLWKKTISLYLETDRAEVLRQTEDRARLLGLMRIMRREIRRGGLEDDSTEKLIAYCKQSICELASQIDRLEIGL